MGQALRKSVVFVWDDRALFIGDRSETAMHAHNAFELCVALDELGIDMADAEGRVHKRVRGAVVRSNARHALTVHGPKVAVLYVDGQSEVAAGLDAWLRQATLAPLPKHVPPAVDFAHLLQRSASLQIAEGVCMELLRALLPESETSQPRDERVVRAIAYLGTQLNTQEESPRLAAVAKHVGLSESRLGHLFKEQVGLPLRRYMLWMRLRSALIEALRGVSMTDAAHSAGFSDAPHFTRTCQSMFGLPPTAFAPVDDVLISDSVSV